MHRPTTDGKIQRHSRSTEKQSLLSEIERAKVEAAESAEALLREETATKASREMCEQMGGVCRQMRQAAEDAEERCSAAEEKVPAVLIHVACRAL